MNVIKFSTLFTIFLMPYSILFCQDEIPINLEFEYIHNLALADCLENTITLLAQASSPDQDIALEGMEIKLIYDRFTASNMTINPVLANYVIVEISEDESTPQVGIDFFDFTDAAVFFEGAMSFTGGTHFVLNSTPTTIFEITLEDVPLVNDENSIFCLPVLWDQASNNSGALAFDGVNPSVQVDFIDSDLESQEIVNHYGWDYDIGNGIFGGIDESEACFTYCAPFGFFMDVEWLSFETIREEDNVELNWKTSQEINNSHFIIQRARNGVDFLDIGRVEGNGNTNTAKSYKYIDSQPFNDNNYYRIMQVDFDGEHSYSDIKAVFYNTKQNLELTLFPNPATDELLFKTNGDDLFETAIIYDIHGKIVQNLMFNEIGDNNAVDISSLKDGIYYFKIIGEHYEEIVSFLKIAK